MNREQLEAELHRLAGENQRQNALINAIFAADPGGLAVVAGPEMRFTYANPAYRYICPTLGQDPTGQPYRAIWPEENGEGFADQIRQVIETGKPFQVLGVERQYPDGTTRSFTFQARRVEWGNELAALLIFWDTTELAETQRQLARLLDETYHQAERLQAVFAAMSDAVLIYDIQGVITQANPALVQILGFDPTGMKREELAGKLTSRRADGHLLTVDELPSVRALSGEKVAAELVQITNPAGRAYLIQMTANLLRDAGQRLTGVVVVWHDVTEQERAAQAAHLSENRYRRLVESNLIGVVVSEPSGKIHDANDAFLAMVGYTREELESGELRWPEMTPPEYLPLDSLRLAEARADGVCKPYEKEYIRKDGSRVPIQISFARLLDEAGDIYICHIQDMSEQKRAERELRESEAYFRQLVELSPDATFVQTGGRFSYVNRVALRMLGASRPEEIIGKPIIDFIHPDFREQVVTRIQTLNIDRQSPPPAEEAFLRLDGTYVLCEVVAAPYVYENRPGAIVIAHDISERVQAEAALRASEARYRTTLNSIGDAVITTDPTGRITFLNPVAERLTGWDSQACEGQPLDCVFHFINEKTGQPADDPVAKVLKEDTVVGLANHTALIARDGRQIPIEDSAAPIKDTAGKTLGVVMVFHDVTEKRRAEDALRQQQSLIELSYEPIFTWALDGGILTWNAGCEQLYGYSREEAIGRSSHELLKTRHPVPLDEIKAQLLAEGRWAGELRHQTKDGREVVIESRHQLTETIGLRLVLETNRDITGRKRAEEEQAQLVSRLKDALAEIESSRAQFEAIYETQNDAVLIYDTERVVQRVNPPFRETYGFDPAGLHVSEIIRRVDCRWLDGRPLTLDDQPTPRALRGEKVTGARYWVKRADGSDIAVETSSAPLREGGRVTGSVTVWHEITELVQTENSLRESEERFRTTLSSIGDAVITTDPTGKVSFLNPVAEQLTGWATLEAAGQPMENVFHIINEKTGQPAADPVAKVLNEGMVVGLANHTALIARDGRQIPIEDSAAPIKDAAGEMLGVVMVFHDVTEKRRAEEKTWNLAKFPAENPNPIVRFSQEGIILYANAACAPLLEHWHCQVGERLGPKIQRFIRRLLESGKSQTNEIENAGKVYVVHFTPIREGGYVNGYAADITGLRERENALNKLNRTLRAMSNSSQAMMRAKDEKGFMQDVCRIVTEDCGYSMVWIGFAMQDEDKTVQPVAHAGFEDGYLETLRITWADSERGRGPTGMAIRTGKPSMCQDMRTDPDFEPWREEAIRRGYSASLVLPLLADQQAFGAITIYSPEVNPFTVDEVKLLSELASDLAYGIIALRLRDAQTKTEQALRESEARYRSLFESMTEGFALHEIICDEQGKPVDYRFLDINPAFEKLTGLTAAEVKGKAKSQVEKLSGDDPKWIEIYGKVALTGKSYHFENYSTALKMHYEVFAYRPAPYQFAVIFINTTESKQTRRDLQLAKETAEKTRAQIEVQRRLIEQREHERMQIARDLHDGPVQVLTAATFTLQGLTMSYPEQPLNDDLTGIQSALLEAISELRGYAQELRPPALFTFGLRKAVQSYLEAFQEKHLELHTQLEVDWTGEPLPEQISIALFRIFQEGLNNIVKHARAEKVWIHLAKEEKNVRLEIQDNGAGFDLPGDLLLLARQGHLGMVGMRERAEAIGGRLEIHSFPGEGTRIVVVAPLEGSGISF